VNVAAALCCKPDLTAKKQRNEESCPGCFFALFLCYFVVKISSLKSGAEAPLSDIQANFDLEIARQQVA